MKSRFLISLALAAATLAVFWRVGHNGFINFDDPDYVYANPHVLTGLSWANVRWALTSTDMANWHPLTWLSHMTDCQLFGLNPAGHHYTNLFLHTVNAVLLFLLLSRLTGTLWRSAFVAALFALHPLHVESVAWVAERKDVLSTLFWMLTMLAYAWYADRPGWRRYVPVLASYALGLMAKPMLVTLPFVLLLLDYWPLGRTEWSRSAAGAASPAQPLLRLVWEKAPLFALAVISCGITFYAQQQGGAVSSLETVPLHLRIANAVAAGGGYIAKMVWPADLAIVYPLERSVPVAGAVLGGVLLLGVSIAVARGAKKHPYLPVGWLWYLGTLVPVIGLVQIGLQSMADRYTYVPLIGLFVMIAWGVPDLLKKWGERGKELAVAATLVLLLLATLTWQRLGDWKDSITLFSQALAVTTNNYGAHNNLGVALGGKGRSDEAVSHYLAALAINPAYSLAYYNLGNQLSNMGRREEAIGYYRQAVRLKPANAMYHNNLGVALAVSGRKEEAAGQFAEAVRLKPDFPDAHYNLGIALLEQGMTGEAARQFSETVRIQPDNADARRKLEDAVRLLNGNRAR